MNLILLLLFSVGDIYQCIMFLSVFSSNSNFGCIDYNKINQYDYNYFV